MEKRCSKCKTTKPLAEFYNCSRAKDGKSSACRSCGSIKNADYRDRPGNREKARRVNADYRDRPGNREKARRVNADYRASQEGKQKFASQEFRQRVRSYPSRAKTPQRAANLKAKYGLSLDDYQTMLEQQNGSCMICKAIPNKHLAVDHCHTTGKIRGLLCGKCNTGLGLFYDDHDLLLTAATYLKTSMENCE